MSILFLLRSLNVGGAERQLLLLASGLQQHGYSVKVVIFYAGSPLEQEAKALGVQIVDLKRQGRWDLIPFFLRLVRFIKREQPEILHSYLQVPNIWSAFVKLVLPDTKVVWGIRASNIEWKDYGWQWQATDKAESLLANIPDWMICNSSAGLEHHVQKGYPRRKMSVVRNGIDTERFFPDRKLGRALRAMWGVQENQTLIGMVGRIDPVKDYPDFLQAAAWLAQERPEVRFVCVGGGPDALLGEYSDLAHSLHVQDVLIWAGEQTEMLQVYNALDLLVLSSVSEGVSNVLGEAMACGIPCVATDVGDSAQLIGSVGELVPARDPEALKQGMLQLLKRIETDGTRLNTQARQWIMEQFSVAKLVSKTIEVLNDVLAGKHVSQEQPSGLGTTRE